MWFLVASALCLWARFLLEERITSASFSTVTLGRTLIEGMDYIRLPKHCDLEVEHCSKNGLFTCFRNMIVRYSPARRMDCVPMLQHCDRVVQPCSRNGLCSHASARMIVR
jgi:hypothetical protein